MKAIICAAGYGTRFLPVTKTIPKEMLPIITKPAISFIIEELEKSKIKDIIIISSRRKKSLEDYFDLEIELINHLKKENKEDLFPPNYKNLNIYFIRQKEMKGTGDAVLLAKDFINNEPFILAYPDDLVSSTNPLSKQLIENYNKNKCFILASMKYKEKDINSYGVLKLKKEYENKVLMKIDKIIEKPITGKEPSKYISIGRYLLTPEIFPLLEKQKNKLTTGELYIADAINDHVKNNKVLALNFTGNRYDIGKPMGYLQAITSYALNSNLYKKEYTQFLKKILNI